MQICIGQPTYFTDTYNSHSKYISHTFSSRWILQLIEVNETLLGIAQIIEVLSVNLKMAGRCLVCVSFKL